MLVPVAVAVFCVDVAQFAVSPSYQTPGPSYQQLRCLPFPMRQALVVVPVGPEETSHLWFAPSRLGVNNWTAQVLGHGFLAVGVWVVIFSKVAWFVAMSSVACLVSCV